MIVDRPPQISSISNGDAGAPRIASQRGRSSSRPGPPLRVDASIASRSFHHHRQSSADLHVDRPFLRPNELTPASSETVSPSSWPHDRKSPWYITQRSPARPLTQGPPSPEYNTLDRAFHTNLDCAFPPFPVAGARSASPMQDRKAPSPRFENVYVKEHAEPYNQSRPTSSSPSAHNRSRSVASGKTRDRSGTLGSRSDPITRPSTANGTRKSSMASISGGPKAAAHEEPPLPSGIFENAAAVAIPASRRSGFVGLRPEPSRAGGLADQMIQRRPQFSDRMQTFPMHNQAKVSGNGPDGLDDGRPSQHSPISTAGRPHPPDTTSLRSLQRTGSAFRTDLLLDQNVPSQEQTDVNLSRNASWNSTRTIAVNRPFPVRKTSRPDFRADMTSSKHPPLPAHNAASDLALTNKSHTSEESVSSNTSSTFLAQSVSSRSSSSPANKTLAREQSDAKDANETSDTLSSDLALLLRPSLSLGPPDSPTDPLCSQGRLSPIPLSMANRPPFSGTSLSSASSGTASPYPSSQVPNRRKTGGGNRGLCRGCSQPIVAGQKSVSSKDGRLSGRYHKQCFACHTCHRAFETADFYVHDDHPFCAEHYHQMNGSLCDGCGNGIEGQYLEATDRKGKAAEKFHPHCLICSSCRVGLEDDYYEWMGKVYCERDAKRAAGAQVRPPSDASVSARPNPWLGPSMSSNASAMGRSGLPAGPRVGQRPPGPVQAPGPGSGFYSAFPPTRGARAPNSGGRFPERRTTKLMMMV